jgi:hypothetical protein
MKVIRYCLRHIYKYQHGTFCTSLNSPQLYFTYTWGNAPPSTTNLATLTKETQCSFCSLIGGAQDIITRMAVAISAACIVFPFFYRTDSYILCYDLLYSAPTKTMSIDGSNREPD